MNERKPGKQTVFLATTLAFMIALSATVLASAPILAQAQQQGAGNGSGNQDRNQTRTQDPSTHENATSNYQQQPQQEQQQPQKSSSSSPAGQQDRNQTRTRDPSTHNAILQERWKNQTQAEFGSIHRLHIDQKAQSVAPYIANLNYTLTANGTAISFTNSADSKDASLKLSMSTWRSNERVVSMDILNGTVTIGGTEEKIQAGSVYYLPAIHQLRVYGLVEYKGDDGNTYVKVLRVTSAQLSVKNTLPTENSQPSYTFDSSTFSRLDAEYYLKLSGEVARAS